MDRNTEKNELSRYQEAINGIDNMCQVQLGQIESLTTTILRAMETPQFWASPLNLKETLGLIQYLAADLSNYVNGAAENVGCTTGTRSTTSATAEFGMHSVQLARTKLAARRFRRLASKRRPAMSETEKRLLLRSVSEPTAMIRGVPSLKEFTDEVDPKCLIAYVLRMSELAFQLEQAIENSTETAVEEQTNG
ncbi:hypothetical protein WKR88_17900 [Trinickia caryophylli]|uniref:Uncharacterized protein n=1 Tax=Trinickia caryophylli TaxID=28094 RepID=A0A1X7DZ06_TRICW|nr:hypothetical protein [Trinickia caryophylli]TRX17836.1 hypothetical protein FNF07_06080 [Trinickia caryophylli]WQE11396.1 hypothetical protein U0034_16840 [Trinickia caryophylli]SMF24067.1 hypothetical protein SAMN06295900_104251 [Trinickia caryophylli]